MTTIGFTTVQGLLSTGTGTYYTIRAPEVIIDTPRRGIFTHSPRVTVMNAYGDLSSINLGWRMVYTHAVDWRLSIRTFDHIGLALELVVALWLGSARRSVPNDCFVRFLVESIECIKLPSHRCDEHSLVFHEFIFCIQDTQRLLFP